MQLTPISDSLSLRLHPVTGLTLLHRMTRGLIMQKACGHTLRCYHTLLAQGFRFYFTPLTGVLFTFPSRYLFTIGHRRVFSLGGWAPRIQTEFHVFRSTWDTAKRCRDFVYGPVTLFGDTFQSLTLSFHTCYVAVPQPQVRGLGLGFSPFVRHY